MARLVFTSNIQLSGVRRTELIIDREGQVRFAYVGSSTADRPSIKAMLAQLDSITN